MRGPSGAPLRQAALQLHRVKPPEMPAAVRTPPHAVSPSTSQVSSNSFVAARERAFEEAMVVDDGGVGG